MNSFTTEEKWQRKVIFQKMLLRRKTGNVFPECRAVVGNPSSINYIFCPHKKEQTDGNQI